MIGFTLLRAKQPDHGARVFEILVNNRLSWWMLGGKKAWSATTVPLLFGVAFIFYYLSPGKLAPQPAARFHEFVHIRQWRAPGSFYLQYFWAMIKGRGYRKNLLEMTAYEETALATAKGLPAWTGTPVPPDPV